MSIINTIAQGKDAYITVDGFEYNRKNRQFIIRVTARDKKGGLYLAGFEQKVNAAAVAENIKDDVEKTITDTEVKAGIKKDKTLDEIQPARAYSIIKNRILSERINKAVNEKLGEYVNKIDAQILPMAYGILKDMKDYKTAKDA